MNTTFEYKVLEIEIWEKDELKEIEKNLNIYGKSGYRLNCILRPNVRPVLVLEKANKERVSR